MRDSQREEKGKSTKRNMFKTRTKTLLRDKKLEPKRIVTSISRTHLAIIGLSRATQSENSQAEQEQGERDRKWARNGNESANRGKKRERKKKTISTHIGRDDNRRTPSQK